MVYCNFLLKSIFNLHSFVNDFIDCRDLRETFYALHYFNGLQIDPGIYTNVPFIESTGAKLHLKMLRCF